ncbi:MAG: phosphotransferase family protein [Verrucomicrobium sp.]|nr:phosphotransferase [Verrucomicrobium sp.]
MKSLDLPIRAATETAEAHGIQPDRCDILQNGSTLVLRLTESLVARVVTDIEGPRQGTEWFARENAVALHMTLHKAPVIPLHPALPPGTYEHLGYTLNFWQFVTAVDEAPDPREAGATLQQCHEVLRTFTGPLPRLAILTESVNILDRLADQMLLPVATIQLLRQHLETSLELLDRCVHQPLHGDAHPGNLMNTTTGLLWTDWEDTFSGPVEWDVASLVWNSLLLEEDHVSSNLVVDSYRSKGGVIDEDILQQCLVARAAVMSAWYPVLYPNPNTERREKLKKRIDWLEKVRRGDAIMRA